MRLFTLCALVLAACDGDSDTDLDLDTNVDTEADTSTDSEVDTDVMVVGDGTAYTLDVSDSASWVYFDLDTGAEVTPADPADASDWDLAFQQFTVHVNGGSNGTGGVEVVALNGEYNAWGSYGDGYPESGWATDSDTTGAVMSGWYSYDSTTHVVSPGDVRYFVRSTEGDVYELRILDYYDEQDNPHVMTFETAIRPGE